MSKKMMKRSLALGALMAFVITGSAMAEEPVYSKYTGTGTESHVSNVYWDGNGGSLTLSKDTNATAIGKQHGSMGLKNFSEIVFDGNYYTSGFLANPGTIVLDNIGTIRQTEGSLVSILFSPQSGGNIVANVENIYMHNVNNAVYGQTGSTVTINATGDVEFTRSGQKTLVGSCNLSDKTINNENKVTINANNIKLTALDGIALNVQSYVWTTGEPPYDELEGKNRLTLKAENAINVDARIAAQVKDGLNLGDAVLDIDAKTATLKAKEYGIWAENKGKAEVDADTVNIVVNNKDGKVYGIRTEKNSQVDVNAKKTTITTVNESGLSYGIDARYGSTVNVTGDVEINATSTDDYAAGVYSVYDGDVTLGTEDSKSDVTIKATCVDGNGDKASGWDNAYGVYAYSHTTNGNDGVVNIFADDLNITVDGAYAYGVFSGSNVDTGEGKSSVVIDANRTQITATSDIGKASALTAYSGSELIVKGDLEASGDYVLQTRGGATVKINESAKNTVNLTGDICFAEPGAVIDADVLVNLSNDKSTFKGNIYSSNADRTNEIKGMKINLSNGATWELSKASIVNNANFGENSNLVLKGDGAQFTKAGDYALNGVGTADVLKVAEGANIKVEGIDYKTYNVATGFEKAEATETYWNVSNLNNLMKGEWVGNAEDGLQLKVVEKEADDIVKDLGVSETTGEFLSNLGNDARDAADKFNEKDGTPQGKLIGLANAAANSNNPVVVAKAAEALQKMAEAGGNSATAANVVNNVTNVTGQRMSFTGGNNGNKGGHGVGLLEEGSGAAIWAQYVHGKDSVEDMPSTAGASSYEGQYNGIVMGVDFKKVGKFQSGVAFNYGEGDSNSVNTTSPTRSDYDFWGVGYYGNIRNADSNVIFDIGYAKTDSDVTSNILGQTYEASPETTTWTAGVKVEKLYQNDNVQIVPYTGLRYMSIDPDNYSTKCGAVSYQMERQDIWLLPLGVSIRQEVVNDNGWVVTPKVDLSYIWAFGDTDSTMESTTAFGSKNLPIGYDVMDDGSWLGLVGVEAAMDDWTFGVSYSYQKGDHSESKKWYVDAKYSF